MITISQAEKITGISGRTLRKMCEDKEIPGAVNPSGQMWILPQEWVDEHKREPEESAGFVPVGEAAKKAGVSRLAMTRAAERGAVTAKRREINKKGQWLINIEDQIFENYIQNSGNRSERASRAWERKCLIDSAKVKSIWEIVPTETVGESGFIHYSPSRPEAVIEVQGYDLLDLIKAGKATEREIEVFRSNVAAWEKNNQEYGDWLEKNPDHKEAVQQRRKWNEQFIARFIAPAETAIKRFLRKSKPSNTNSSEKF